jgi:hypothetical protein
MPEVPPLRIFLFNHPASAGEGFVMTFERWLQTRFAAHGHKLEVDGIYPIRSDPPLGGDAYTAGSAAGTR